MQYEMTLRIALTHEVSLVDQHLHGMRNVAAGESIRLDAPITSEETQRVVVEATDWRIRSRAVWRGLWIVSGPKLQGGYHQKPIGSAERRRHRRWGFCPQNSKKPYVPDQLIRVDYRTGRS